MKPKVLGEWWKVEMVLKSGRVVALKTIFMAGNRGRVDPLGEALEQALENARGLAPRAVAPDELVAGLAREGVSGAGWLEALRSLPCDQTYRERAVADEDLQLLIHSVGVAPAVRAAAALASEDLETEGRSRVRVLAEGYVEPGVQEHLLRIADAPQEEEISASLDALETIEQERQ